MIVINQVSANLNTASLHYYYSWWVRLKMYLVFIDLLSTAVRSRNRVLKSTKIKKCNKKWHLFTPKYTWRICDHTSVAQRVLVKSVKRLEIPALILLLYNRMHVLYIVDAHAHYKSSDVPSHFRPNRTQYNLNAAYANSWPLVDTRFSSLQATTIKLYRWYARSILIETFRKPIRVCRIATLPCYFDSWSLVITITWK